jgi:hypothetical protein
VDILIGHHPHTLSHRRCWLDSIHANDNRRRLGLSSIIKNPQATLRPKCCENCDAAKLRNHPGRISRAALAAVFATLVSGKHPCLFSRGLRTSRDCDQRFCDRPTTSKQTAATKHSIRAKNFSGSTRIPSVSGESRQKTWRQNEVPSRRRQCPGSNPVPSPATNLRIKPNKTPAHKQV